MHSKFRKTVFGLSFMFVGSVAIIGTLLMINRLAQGPDERIRASNRSRSDGPSMRCGMMRLMRSCTEAEPVRAWRPERFTLLRCCVERSRWMRSETSRRTSVVERPTRPELPDRPVVRSTRLLRPPPRRVGVARSTVRPWRPVVARPWLLRSAERPTRPRFAERSTWLLRPVTARPLERPTASRPLTLRPVDPRVAVLVPVRPTVLPRGVYPRMRRVTGLA